MKPQGKRGENKIQYLSCHHPIHFLSKNQSSLETKTYRKTINSKFIIPWIPCANSFKKKTYPKKIRRVLSLKQNYTPRPPQKNKNGIHQVFGGCFLWIFVGGICPTIQSIKKNTQSKRQLTIRHTFPCRAIGMSSLPRTTPRARVCWFHGVEGPTGVLGCPRKLGSMVSKWVITLIYSIYK